MYVYISRHQHTYIYICPVQTPAAQGWEDSSGHYPAAEKRAECRAGAALRKAQVGSRENRQESRSSPPKEMEL